MDSWNIQKVGATVFHYSLYVRLRIKGNEVFKMTSRMMFGYFGRIVDTFPKIETLAGESGFRGIMMVVGLEWDMVNVKDLQK